MSKLSSLSTELTTLANEGIHAGPLVLKIVETCLECIVDSKHDITEAQVLCYTISTEVLCDLENCKKLIW